MLRRCRDSLATFLSIHLEAREIVGCPSPFSPARISPDGDQHRGLAQLDHHDDDDGGGHDELVARHIGLSQRRHTIHLDHQPDSDVIGSRRSRVSKFVPFDPNILMLAPLHM